MNKIIKMLFLSAIMHGVVAHADISDWYPWNWYQKAPIDEVVQLKTPVYLSVSEQIKVIKEFFAEEVVYSCLEPFLRSLPYQQLRLLPSTSTFKPLFQAITEAPMYWITYCIHTMNQNDLKKAMDIIDITGIPMYKDKQALARLEELISDKTLSYYGDPIPEIMDYLATIPRVLLLKKTQNFNASYGRHDISIDSGFIRSGFTNLISIPDLIEQTVITPYIDDAKKLFDPLISNIYKPKLQDFEL